MMIYPWLVVGLTMIMQSMSYGIMVYTFGLFVVPWLNDFDATRADVMLAVFALQIVSGVLSPFAGRMLDRYPLKWLVPFGGVLLASGLLLLSFAGSMWQLTLLYATVLPAAITLTGPLAAQTIITRWFHQKRGLAIGISATGTSIGGFVLPVLCGALLAAYDWRITMQFLAFLALVLICPLSWLILRRKPLEISAPVHSDSNTEVTAEHTASQTDQRIWTTGEILSNRNFWLPVLALLPLALAFGGIQFNLAAYAQDLGNTLQKSAWLISIMSVSMIFGKLFFGLLADRMDHRKLYWIAAGFMILTLILIQGGPGFVVLAISSALLGVSAGGLLPLMGAIYSQRFGVRSFGRVMGLVTLIITLGGIGPLIAGAVFDATGNYDAAFMLFIVILIPPALGMIWLKNNHGESSPR